MTLDKQAIRVIITVLTRPDDKRDLRTAARVMALDANLKAAIDPYDEDLEKLVAQARKVATEYPPGSDYFRDEMTRINTEIGALDEVAAKDPVTVNLEDAHFDLLKDTIYNLRGVPTDRKAGPIYLRIMDAIEGAEKVKPKLAAVP
jgi:hypothetical protein